MADAWEERKKALENEYFYKLEKEQVAKLKEAARERLIRENCRNRVITSYSIHYTKLYEVGRGCQGAVEQAPRHQREEDGHRVPSRTGQDHVGERRHGPQRAEPEEGPGRVV